MACIGLGWQQPAALAALTSPILANSAPLSVPVGLGAADVATLYYGAQPTGRITFRAFSPGDLRCIGAPAFTSTVDVNGNGRYSSTYFYPAAAGTYRWKASYGGDARNNPATTSCSDLGSAWVVSKRSPTVRLSASVSADGTTTTATATIFGAGPNGPTGALTLALYGPNNLICLPPAALTSTVQVLGNGPYSSVPATPGRAGTYRWVASYGGDANNYGAGTLCNGGANAVTIRG